MSYTYDSLNRLSTVVDNRLSGSSSTTYSYDDASNVGTVTYPNGVQSTFTYDTLNRVSGLSSQVSGYTYQRGPSGNLTSATESNGRTESWSYDGIYRLTNETISLAPSGKNGSVGYGLDPVGNRTSDTSSLSGISSGSFSYNPDDELASESYDQNGNILATGGKTFTYDSQNELISMGGTASLLYDADGNRVSKTVSGVVTKYLVDDLNPTGYPQVVDELTNGAVTRTYTYGLQRIDEDQIISSTWTPSFYGYDGGGNVRQLTNSAGAVTDTYEYDAFGNEVNHTGTTPNNYLYRGEQYDPDLGLYYLRARYYNALTGRLMSRDPKDGKNFDPKTLHRFLYADGDPVNLADPTGREVLFGEGAIDRDLILEVPGAIIDGVGFASSQAAEFGAEAALRALALATTQAEALADFLAAVDWAATANSVAKVFVCAGVEQGIGDLLDKHEGEGFTDFVIPDEAVQAFREACLGFLAPY
jgi:RHS repeat-associated protein